MATWNREPLFHITGPLECWNGPKPERHHESIDKDFPECCDDLELTVEVEAKEADVSKLKAELEKRKLNEVNNKS